MSEPPNRGETFVALTPDRVDALGAPFSEPPRASLDPEGGLEHRPSAPDELSAQPERRADAHGHSAAPQGWKRTLGLAVAALGVVYGDLGTSPLYAMRECFHGAHGTQTTPQDVLGVLSLFFWALTLVVVHKYISFVTRADNHGEGGILALLALVMPRRGGRTAPLVLLGLFGASLLYAEGILTPAISVLSAVEGIAHIEGIGPRIEVWVIPIAIAILVGLFVVQRRGTAKVGLFFGPIVAVWFLTIGGLGLYWIAQRPEVLWAVSPHHAVSFFVRHQGTGFWVLGSVVLCITGVEALYADMGHFGRRPIVLAWLCAAFPALILNYFGQGALLLEHPGAVDAPFFSMVSGAWRIPLVLLATAATVIASQALISGAFSLTRQAIQLGYLPRLEIRHTSSETEGQIYLPEVNRLLMVACIIMVLLFGSSTKMAAAYGIAVTGTMATTTILFFTVARRWWGDLRAGLLCGGMLAIDIAFFTANLNKLQTGGWIPLAIGVGILSMFTTWKTGRDMVYRFLRERSRPLEEFLDEVDARDPVRVTGTAVFMTSTGGGTPPVLLHHFTHNKVLHEQVVLLSIVTEDVPAVTRSHRVEVERLREGFFRVTARYGFMQSPRVTDILRGCAAAGLHTQPEETSYYLGREKLLVTKNPGMAGWRKALFAFLSRNARPATDFFKLPPDRVVEMGMQLEL